MKNAFGFSLRAPLANLLTEVIGTVVLISVAAAIASKQGFPIGLSPGLSPFLVGLLVWSIGLSLGGSTGYAIDPVRDLGPRIVHALLPIRGKGGSDWAAPGFPSSAPSPAPSRRATWSSRWPFSSI